MKIKAPLIGKKEVSMLIEAGADELYCGVCHEGVALSDRRAEHNLKNIQELKEVIEISQSYNTAVSLALNGKVYGNYQKLIYVAEKAADFGINSFIIYDNTLLHILDKLGLGIDIHISCMTCCFNNESINFYKDKGVKRITLPRQLTIREIKDISKRVKGIDLDVMIYGGKCKNDNGFCRFNHPEMKTGMLRNMYLKIKKYDTEDYALLKKLTPEKKSKLFLSVFNFANRNIIRPCAIDYDIGPHCGSTFNNLNIDGLHTYFSKSGITACGLCAIYAFSRTGIKSLKIVGRGYPLILRLCYTQLLKESIKLLKKTNNKKQFEEQVKQLQFSLIRHSPCNNNTCYYY